MGGRAGLARGGRRRPETRRAARPAREDGPRLDGFPARLFLTAWERSSSAGGSLRVGPAGEGAALGRRVVPPALVLAPQLKQRGRTSAPPRARGRAARPPPARTAVRWASGGRRAAVSSGPGLLCKKPIFTKMTTAALSRRANVIVCIERSRSFPSREGE